MESEVHAERAAVAEQLAAQIHDAILRGEYAPGEALREVALADAYRVSRRTVREALLSLAARRLVTHERNRGATVRTYTPDDVRDLYLVRRMLELEGARRSPFASDTARRRLSETFARLDVATRAGDSRTMVIEDLAFHGAVVALAGSPRLEEIYGQVAGEMEMALTLIRAGEVMGGFTAEQVIADHFTIHNALIARDVIEAQRAMLAHIEFNERLLLQVIGSRADVDPTSAQ